MANQKLSVAKPQDHKPKAPKVVPFTFTGKDGETYTLPPVTTAQGRISGGEFEDAMMGGELGMMAYMVKVLRASDASSEAREALRALPQDQYMDVITAWGNYGDGDGASLGESSGSST